MGGFSHILSLYRCRWDKLIYEPDSSITHVYFPTTSTVAPLYGVENGSSVQLSIIGNEGLTGISSLLGGGSTPCGSGGAKRG